MRYRPVCIGKNLQNFDRFLDGVAIFQGINFGASGEVISRSTGLNEISLERSFNDQHFHVVLMYFTIIGVILLQYVRIRYSVISLKTGLCSN